MSSRVIVVGAGPVGLTLALRLAQLGVRVVVVEAAGRQQSEGSKALVMQRETLESWARLGFGDRVAERGTAWKLARTYYRNRELFRTRFPDAGRAYFPPFVNISQTEVEHLMIAECERDPRIELRWSHRVVGIHQSGEPEGDPSGAGANPAADPGSRTDGVRVHAETPGGPATVTGAYAVGVDGSGSQVRKLLGIDFPGRSHEDKFLIADIRAELPFPDERRFYFDPPWNPGRQVLVHPQPDSVWRIDWQVPPDTDLDAERSTGRLDTRIRRIVGAAPYEVTWLTLYRFHQRVATRFRRGRVFLAGDAAHVFAPFGARGLNSGVGDAENLAWKLAHVLARGARPGLLDTYESERRSAALENLAVTDATMRFLTPPGRLHALTRNAVLRLSRFVPAARTRVDSGKLAQPHVYAGSAIVEPEPSGNAGHGGTDGAGGIGAAGGAGRTAALPRNGGVMPDGPCALHPGGGAVRARELVADRPRVLLFPRDGPTAGELLARYPARAGAAVCVVPPGTRVPGARQAPPDSPDSVTLVTDEEGVLAATFCPGRLPGAGRAYVVRPDWHIAARRELAVPADVEELPGLADAAGGAMRPPATA